MRPHRPSGIRHQANTSMVTNGADAGLRKRVGVPSTGKGNNVEAASRALSGPSGMKPEDRPSTSTSPTSVSPSSVQDSFHNAKKQTSASKRRSRRKRLETELAYKDFLKGSSHVVLPKNKTEAQRNANRLFRKSSNLMQIAEDYRKSGGKREIVASLERSACNLINSATHHFDKIFLQ